MSNSVPNPHDSDGVLVARFSYLHFPNSNYGAEIIGLYDTLWEDRETMLRCAVAGLQRLIRQGHFTETTTHKRITDRVRIWMDPVDPFVREYLVVTGEPKEMIPMADLHALFNNFAVRANITNYSLKGFGKVFWSKDDEGRAPLADTRRNSEFGR